ncbi:MAG: hypothetical protein HY841_06710 [Bacteroidetes bacterium]|nr:hypothetical protein [Bacteroidota bacterium]
MKIILYISVISNRLSVISIIFLSICFLLGLNPFGTSYVLLAQDSTLPQGNSRIQLFSGKEIKHVRLWKIDTTKVEYVINGNLMDVKTSDVKKIETPTYLITFNEEKKILKKNYDLIVPYYGDTIRCFILKEDEWVISYLPAGSDTKKSITKSAVKTYLQWPEQKPETPAPTLKGEEAGKNMKKEIPDTSQHPLGLVANEQRTIPAQTNADDYYDAKKKLQVSVPLGEVDEKEKWNNMQSSYYYQSYQRGVSDAVRNYKGGWAAGGFCTGMTFGSPFVSSAAINSKVSFEKIPSGVDEKLYRNGYENEMVKMRTKKAAGGASVAKGIIGFIIFIALASAGL